MVYILYDITSSRTFYFLFSNPIINVVTILLDVPDMIDHSNPNPRVLKMEKCEIIQNKIKMRKKIEVHYFYFLYITSRILILSLHSTRKYWKKQSAQQHGVVQTTGNHLPVVYTSMKS